MNISGTPEQICTIFTWKTRLVPPSDEFDCQSHQGQNTAFFCPFGGLHVVYVLVLLLENQHKGYGIASLWSDLSDQERMTSNQRFLR